MANESTLNVLEGLRNYRGSAHYQVNFTTYTCSLSRPKTYTLFEYYSTTHSQHATLVVAKFYAKPAQISSGVHFRCLTFLR